MDNLKTSKKQPNSSKNTLSSLPTLKLKKGTKTRRHDPDKVLRNKKFVAKALGEALLDNDTEAFKEILLGHLRAVDKQLDVIEKSGLSKTTFYQALSPKGNPSLKTLGKIISALAA